MAEAAKDEVLRMVKLISQEQLEELCGKFDITVAEERRTKPKAYLNALSRFISSTDVEDMDDEGLDLFQEMIVELKKYRTDEDIHKEDSKAAVKEIGKQKSGTSLLTDGERKLRDEMERAELLKEKFLKDSASASSSSEKTTTMFHRFKTRPFHIHSGTVGGEKSLSWSSLCFQMDQGESLGYYEKEIMVLMRSTQNVPSKRFLKEDRGRRVRFMKCNACIHCWECGDETHKKQYCPNA